MPTAAIMIQGTNSNAGKSVLVAGLCRAYWRRGLQVQPFKPQNMSNNAAAVPGGGEIGRAQALQAKAAGVGLSVHQNPVLLKPESDRSSQVVVKGYPVGNLEASRFSVDRGRLLEPVMESFAAVGGQADLVIVEGAGSPAETNLRKGDIANMGFAEAAGVPVIMAGDIDRGGVIASLVGTHVVLSDSDRQRIKGFLINKFRGDVGLFADGLADVTDRTGWPSLGVVTWCRVLAKLPAEDAVALEHQAADAESGVEPEGGSEDGSEDGSGDVSNRPVTIAVPMLSRIANVDDLDPLHLEPGVSVTMVPPGRPLPIADLIIIPGTKATIADLRFLREQGWDIDLAAHVRRGGRVLGLCGGYQMLGRSVADPDGIEGLPGTVTGLGLLDVSTVLLDQKITRPVNGHHVASGVAVGGYEIHVGHTDGPGTERPWLRLENGPSGAVSANGSVEGSYVHGVFANDAFRSRYLASIRTEGSNLFSGLRYDQAIEDALDVWADQLEQQLDLDRMLGIASVTYPHRNTNHRRSNSADI